MRRDTGGNYRIFQAGGFVEISGLTITNGRTPDGVSQEIAESGGGILHTNGSLVLRNVVITGNATGNGSPNRIINPGSGAFGGFGGGIYSEGSLLEMTDCVVSNNTTGNGGNGSSSGGSGGRGAGIYFGQGNMRLTNVTLTGNRTGDSGTPCCGNSGYGGGLWIGNDFLSLPLNVSMDHVTITNNSTGNNITTGDAGWRRRYLH